MTYQMTALDRLVAAYYGGNYAEFARTFNVSRQVVQNWRARNRVTRDKAIEIITKHPVFYLYDLNREEFMRTEMPDGVEKQKSLRMGRRSR